METTDALWPTDKFSSSASYDGYFGLTTDNLSYFISSELLEQQPDVLKTHRVVITEYLKSKRGEKNVLLTTETIDYIIRFPVPGTAEKLVRSLRHIAKLADSTTRDVKVHSQGDDIGIYQLMRDLSVATYRDIRSLLKHLETRGLADVQLGQGWISSSVTINGFLFLDEQGRERATSNTAFVAMWFSEETSNAFVEGIAPAIATNGYLPIRIDHKEHNNKIDDEIVAEIRRSRFVVADFSCGADGARGGVYFEAGFAQGIGIPVIFCVRESDLSRVHFDTRQFSHIVWTDVMDLKQKLANRIAATIT